ncbi:tyrosine-type recombinase/integrase [Streptomyces mirabilis]|uniref:tyrosine-type recombinase/integrase n=1 Tax=Streptomyces TaxID=1883 RepID=UPI00196719B2|nr:MULTISPECIES: tyrosine-type recombinase/integrase [Streptomyces]MCX4615666.1 tyrosine-type recombinase/integrase [Streptomyces mirabilis]MCX5355458.1 tyrosine-type recombinase/integrase [Streptomyces mirabilis]
MIHERNRVALARLIDPLEAVSARWGNALTDSARNMLLMEVGRRSRAYWAWDEQIWTVFVASVTGEIRHRRRAHLVAWGYLFGGHRRLHHRVGMPKLRPLADFVFGHGAVDPALEQVCTLLERWETSPKSQPELVRSSVLDALLSAGSPHLKDVTLELLQDLVADHPASSARRRGLFKMSRVLAANGFIPEPLTGSHQQRGTRPETVASVPLEWLEMVRWRKFSTNEPGTIRTKFPLLLVAGRWAAERHPEATSPQAWTRDIAAEYIADAVIAVRGQWAGHNRNRTGWGEPLSASGKAGRVDTIRSFFCDLIEWEWITPRFDPRRVLALPLSVRAGRDPDPRIIDDAAWAKLMAAGLTLTCDDLRAYGTPRAKAAGWHANHYPIEMIRALVGVWLFGGLRMDEIRRLELECVRWDQATDPDNGETYRVCLLHIPANKTTAAFSKPVDPIVGELIDAWKDVRPAQPDITDRKTGQRRQHLFCYRAQLIGSAYLNDKLIAILCAKAGIPESDSRGALTSHRARATIATQLLNANDPLSLADLQQWLGHKHPSSTRYYVKILQRTLSAAYKKADYFARNVRTIQVLVDRESILTGAAASGEQPWKYYDLGEGYCSYDFFAKCPHRLACACCPFYVPKTSSRGQLLAVKDDIDEMLEQLNLTDDEREALEGDREAVTALAERLTDTPTPAGPTHTGTSERPAPSSP